MGAQRHIVDPDDRSSIITNSYDGETLASEDVVTSVLDGVTSSALLDNQHPCNAFYTASLTSRLDFGVVTPGFKTAPLSYFYMRKMYRLLALEMVGRDKYAEVEVGLKYGGEKIEEGFARLALVLDNGMSGMASKRRSIKRRGGFFVSSVSRRVDAMSRETGELLADWYGRSWEGFCCILYSLQQYLPRFLVGSSPCCHGGHCKLAVALSLRSSLVPVIRCNHLTSHEASIPYSGE